MDLILIGAGGHAREIAGIIHDLARHGHPLRVLGVAADWGYDPEFWGHAFGAAHLGTLDDVKQRDGGVFVPAVGKGADRQSMTQRFMEAGWSECPPLVHPSATVAPASQLQPGCVVFPGARVSVNVRLDRGCHLNVNASVGHDSRLDEFCSVNPAGVVSGNVALGARSTVGANATILEGLTVATDVTLGAGAVLTANADSAGETLAGVPARRLTKKGPHGSDSLSGS